MAIVTQRRSGIAAASFSLRQSWCYAGLLVAQTSISAQNILPPPIAPIGNPSTPDKVRLGQALFWDEQLSSSHTVACGTCHILSRGGADPRTDAVHPGFDRVLGTDDDVRGSAGVARQDRTNALVFAADFGLSPQVTTRKAPSVINAAYAESLFGDGRATGEFRDPITGAVLLPKHAALESQAVGPLMSDVEMAHIGRTWSDLLTALPSLQPLALASNVPAPLAQFIAGRTYGPLFQQVFGTPGVTAERIAFAIAAYERTLISDQSPYDLYLAGRGTLTAAELGGLAKFQQFCVACHTDLAASVLRRGPVQDEYRNIGVRPIAEDSGRYAVTGHASDRGRFRVPGLRNVALRAPYFHNGSAGTLSEVIDFYARGGDFHVNQDPRMAVIPGHIENVDRILLQRFLEALTDPRVRHEQPPFDRPTLWSESASAPSRVGAGTAPRQGLTPRASFNLPPTAGNHAFMVGVDRVPAGAQAALCLDGAGQATPIRLFGVNIHLGMTPSLVAIVLPGPTRGTSPTDGFATLALPIPATVAPGTRLFAQWLVVDPRGPQGVIATEALVLPVL